jgi:hypothetical protein
MSGTRDERPMSRVGMNEMREMRLARVKGLAKGGEAPRRERFRTHLHQRRRHPERSLTSRWVTWVGEVRVATSGDEYMG